MYHPVSTSRGRYPILRPATTLQTFTRRCFIGLYHMLATCAMRRPLCVYVACPLVYFERASRGRLCLWVVCPLVYSEKGSRGRLVCFYVVCPRGTLYKMKGHFNHIFRLSQLHQSGIIIRSPKNASKMGFLNSIQELLHYFVF